jgi:hypothetical protein
MKPQNNELIQEAYKLFGVSDPLGFQRAYSKCEQVHFKDGTWNAYNPELLFNRAKVLIELMDFKSLSDDEKNWFTAVLWLWYHHAVSYESHRYRAKIYAKRAMDLQGENPYNRLSQLLWHLTCDDVPAARSWLNCNIEDWDPDDRQTGIELTDNYENGNPWLWTYE